MKIGQLEEEICVFVGISYLYYQHPCVCHPEKKEFNMVNRLCCCHCS